MNDMICSWLNERALYLENTIREKEVALRKAPEGHLRFTHNKEKLNYYCRNDPGNTSGTYIRKDNLQFAAALAQKDYDAKVLHGARKELTEVRNLLHYTGHDKIEQIYESLAPPRRQLIQPISLSDKKYAEAWEAVTWQKKPVSSKTGEYYTSKGEQVRSKSEILIADMLARYQIPYRYEYPIEIAGNVFYPDFTILHLRKRQDFIWEHFGMIDQPEYAQMAVSRIEMLEFNGYYPGINFLMTFETENMPLNTKLAARFIEKYLL